VKETDMTQVAQVMTSGVRSMLPSDSLQFAAQAMDELNVGVIPVCDGERLIGMVTDRDIAVRGVAQGRPADSTPISEVMSENVRWVFEDQSLDEATAQMQYAQIRRLPVLDRNHRLVGILALGDVAAKTYGEEAGDVLSNISEPAEPDRSGNSAASGGPASGRHHH
jgi:CBS domain-containing protein